jgi:predicted helicase
MDTKKPLAQIFHFDLYGKRQDKYDFLNDNSLNTINWNELQPNEPNFFFVKKDFDETGNYEKGFKVDELFIENNTGLNTEFDELAIQDTQKDAESLLNMLKNKTEDEVIAILKLDSTKRNKVKQAILDVKNNNPRIVQIKIKPFEEKFCIYTGKSNGIMGRPRHEIMKNLLNGTNMGLISMRQYAFDVPYHCYTFLSKQIVTSRLFISNKGYCSVFPLYLYPEPTAQQTLDASTGSATGSRKPNLNPEIVKQIAEKLGLEFTAEKIHNSPLTINNYFAPIDILDYIYAVLHSPTYRVKYKEFLKIDFPRVPYPVRTGQDLSLQDVRQRFWQLVSLGCELRQIHLLESPVVENYITQYPIDGNNIVCKIRAGSVGTGLDLSVLRVYINDTQYFDNVPAVAWNFYIGGYQPAQKWLKDRKDRTLGFEDILHYQKIIVALSETDRLMKEIDLVGVE